MSVEDIRGLVRDLHRRQIELERENAELREAQLGLEQRVHAGTAHLRGRTNQPSRESLELGRRAREFRTLADNVPALFSYIGRDLHYCYVNRRYEDFWHRPADAIVGQRVAELVGPQGFEVAQPYLEAVLQGQEVIYEADFDVAGAHRTMQVQYVPDRDKSGDVQGLFALSTDITERKRTEKALRESEAHLRELTGTLEERAARLRGMTLELALVEDKNRKKLAGDLHDDLGQLLTLIHTKLSLLKNVISEIEPSEAASALEEIEGLTQRADETTRSVMFQLSPPILHDLGLLPAIRWLGEEMGRLYGIDVLVEQDHRPRVLHEHLKLVLFRAVRELLVNAAKHAHTRDVRVGLSHPEGFVKLVVADRGEGFDVMDASRARKGLGLFSLRERIESMGGAVEIHSKPNEGTRVTLRIPISGGGGSAIFVPDSTS
jgi:PAS domain S-box-containing protein